MLKAGTVATVLDPLDNVCWTVFISAAYAGNQLPPRLLIQGRTENVSAGMGNMTQQNQMH